VLHELVVHRPHPALRPLLAGVVGYHEEGLPPGVHRGLPSPHLTVIITVDEPLVLAAHPDPRQPPGSFDALVGGLHLRPALVAHSGRQFGVQLSLTPRGARGLLGVPAAEMASLDCDLVDVIGRPAVELTEQLRAARDWPGRFAAIDDVLLRVARTGTGMPDEVAEAWRLTTATHGRIRVDQIAREVGWSTRHLTQRFRDETGLCPKAAARVVRFDRARRALAGRVTGGRPADLARLAAWGGFYDQSHLTAEWGAFTGLPPRRWIAAEFGFLQDAAVVAETG
jgi:AraC-like DNA-binding protein